SIIRMLGILALLVASIVVAPAGADTARASVSVTDVQVSPAALMPGDTGTITITLANGQKALAGSTTTSSDTYNYAPGTSGGMTTPSHVSVSSTTSSNAPDGSFIIKEVTLLADAPIRVVSNGFNDVGRMGMGDTARFTFTIKADDNAADTVYTLTLKVRTDDGEIYLNYPVKVQVDSDAPQLFVSDYAETYNGTENNKVSLDVVNPRGTPIDSVKVIASGDEFVFEPQDFFIGTLKAGDMYTAEFTVDSRGDTYGSVPQFVMVYRNGDNWHQTAPVTVAPHAPRKGWWDAWTAGLWASLWSYFAAGALSALVVVALGAVVSRRVRHFKNR
ncbi:MAG TPA: hypothetical protein VMC61_00800, partial [Methanocella sp.]|nr:hypothetical protein [Methanocella sp.]